MAILARRLLAAPFLVVVVFYAPLALPAETQLSEYDVKAAFLLNFTKFVDWPSNVFADATSPLVVCIVGRRSIRSGARRNDGRRDGQRQEAGRAAHPSRVFGEGVPGSLLQ